MDTYRIVRNYFRDSSASRRKRVIRRGLTLEEAQQHCSDPETSSRTCKLAVNVRRTNYRGPWFDGYEQE